jgi:hypothetical protein
VTRVLYLVATGYSGSTLLAFLANGHPRIATVGEVTGPIAEAGDPRAYPCSCGATLADCAFWRGVAAQMQQRGHAFSPARWNLTFDPVPHPVARQALRQSLRSNALDDLRDAAALRLPGVGERLRETARRYRAFVESVLALTGREVFLDATKDASQARWLLRLVDFDFHVIHLVRDAPGFVSSFVKNQGGAPLAAGIRYWNRTAAHARRLAERLPPDRFLRVRYEDLCTATEVELARIARFAGLAPAPGPVDFRAGCHHVIGNRMRLADSSAVVLDESWRGRLSAAQVTAIERATRANRLRFGYA